MGCRVVRYWADGLLVDLMNILQLLDMDRFGPVICTLNPTFPIDESKIQARAEYEHPTFNAAVSPSFPPNITHHLFIPFHI